MCFISRKKLNKIEKIETDVKELSEFIKTHEYERLREDSDDLKRIKELLSKVVFKVKDVKYFEEDQIVQIRYELPVINLQIDEEGNPSRNEFFYSSNMLNMISVDDARKIQEVLNKLKK